MMQDENRLHELLFLYIEEREFGSRELTQDEREWVRERLCHDETFHNEAEAIEKHLRLMNTVKQPEIPGDLTNQCLQRIQNSIPKQSSFRPIWIFQGSCAVLAIFLLGVCFDRTMLRQPAVSPFTQLVNAQTHLIGRLEIELASRYNVPVLDEENPWYQPIQALRSTSRAIAVAHQKHAGDTVIERGLALAITQNIQVLKTLCAYVESTVTIPEFDSQLIDTTNRPFEKAI